MRRDRLKVTTPELLLLTIDLLRMGNGEGTSIDGVSGILGVKRRTVHRYVSDLARKGYLLRAKSRPVAVKMTSAGTRKCEEISEKCRGFRIVGEGYGLDRIMDMDYFFKHISSPNVLIPFLRKIREGAPFDIPEYLGLRSSSLPGSRFTSILNEMRSRDEDSDTNSLDLSSLKIHDEGDFDDVYDLDRIGRLLLECDRLRRQGKIDEALSIYESLLEKCSGLRTNEYLMVETGLIQSIRYKEGPREALERIDSSLNQALNSVHKGQLRRIKADILSDLGEFEEAERFYIKALGTFRSGNYPNLLALTFNNMGVMYFRMERLEEAEKYWKKTRGLSLRENLPWARALSLTNLSDLYALNGRIRSARRMLKEALTIFERLGDLEGQSGVHFNLSLVLIEAGKRELAVKYFLRSAEFPMRYSLKRKERYEVFRERFEKMGWFLPFHLNTPP